MSHPCERNNPLPRGGTDRDRRPLAALDPDHFCVDERTLADFILFARRYAQHIRFHPLPDAGPSADSSWEPFFSQDVSVNLALLATLPLQRFLDFGNGLRRFLEQDQTLDPATRNAHFALLLHLPLLLFNEIGACARRLPRNEALVRQLDKWAGRELQDELLLLKRYVLGAEAAPLQAFTDQPLPTALLHFDDTSVSPLPLVPGPVAERLTSHNWSSLADAVFAAFPDALDGAALAAAIPDPTPFQYSATHHDQVRDALNYNLLIGAVEKLLSSVQAVIALGTAALDASLQRDDHTPHYGLWLTFLRLYRHPQALLNRFTARHLDFHYRDVLQLQPLPPTADQAALVFELARHKSEYLLPSGTLFNAGKGADNEVRRFALLRDTVINRGRVAALKGFFVQRDGAASRPYAATQVDSADGIGAALEKQDPQWPAFGPAHANSAARPGLAVGDPKLRLSDGAREITLVVTFATPLPTAIQQVFAADLSTADGWLELTDSQLQTARSGNTLTFSITLDGAQPGIEPYDPAIHGDNLTTAEPVLRLRLKPDSGRFHEWVGARVSQLRLRVTVRGTRQFSLTSDQGALDPTKPGQPFGALPKLNRALFLGGRELFSKPLASLTLHPQWQEPFGVDTHFSRDIHPFAARVCVEYLRQGSWQTIQEPLLPLFADAATGESWQQLAAYLVLLRVFGIPAEQVFYNQASYVAQLARAYTNQGLRLEGFDTRVDWDAGEDRYGSDRTAGFICFRLQTAFGHEQHPGEHTLALLANASPANTLNYSQKNNINYDGVLPKAPYTPVLTALTLDYASTEDSPAQWFHLYPFGHRVVSGHQPTLLPPLDNAGELYIGLADLQPPQSVSLLFAAVDGSSNPLKPPATLHWHYLRGNDWVEIPATAISDSSSSLSGSGIIAFELPADADTDHSILPGGLHWLRLSVTSDIDAVCNLLGIHAQAALAARVDTDAAGTGLGAPLPAGSIAKLMVPDSAIKSVRQILPSFGGKPREGEATYRQRVSERLRHKDRAVAIWDYEHLVLQNFPQVYKVRCLNHTALCRDDATGTLAEDGQRPGAVLVVPIPLLHPGSAANPHRPYNTTRTLAEIDAFLRKRISPFVHLEVQNPRIEEIQLDFRVAFTAGIIDSGYYLEVLNDELKRFLMPWAYGGSVQVDFGGKWYKSVLIDFIEERPYVDYIRDVRLLHRRDILDAGQAWQLQDREVVSASAARSILVSHPQHRIRQIDEVAA